MPIPNIPGPMYGPSILDKIRLVHYRGAVRCIWGIWRILVSQFIDRNILLHEDEE